uniref:Serine hydrolase (FSH1) putative n=1 Tax=Albugo laibachii Nc14 TaxID=890382 RepID=F0W8T2_9STRA|nr:serine hydrolase (FSH1) putative [Albugo laibachii Nc14]|eukprot:CCA17541.1 serine hydrolase (FSH1) putative [Albugo laibachii Nc14]
MLGQITKKSTHKIVKATGLRSISRSSMRMGGDGHHQHYVFEGDFSRKWVTGLAIGVVGGGVAYLLTIMSKYHVLCLHGYRQNGLKLRGRLAAYRRAFKSKMEFACFDGPISVPYAPTNEEHSKRVCEGEEVATNQFSWWDFDIDEQTGKHTYSRVNETIDYIAKLCKEHGPFDGILGFSQGGMLAMMLLQLQTAKLKEHGLQFKFGIFIAAGISQDGSYNWSNLDGMLLDIPTVHIMGRNDAVVSIERSEMLAQAFLNPIVFIHEGGHYIPANKEPKDILRDFYDKIIVKLEASSSLN